MQGCIVFIAIQRNSVVCTFPLSVSVVFPPYFSVRYYHHFTLRRFVRCPLRWLLQPAPTQWWGIIILYYFQHKTNAPRGTKPYHVEGNVSYSRQCHTVLNLFSATNYLAMYVIVADSFCNLSRLAGCSFPHFLHLMDGSGVSHNQDGTTFILVSYVACSSCNACVVALFITFYCFSFLREENVFYNGFDFYCDEVWWKEINCGNVHGCCMERMASFIGDDYVKWFGFSNEILTTGSICAFWWKRLFINRMLVI